MVEDTIRELRLLQQVCTSQGEADEKTTSHRGEGRDTVADIEEPYRVHKQGEESMDYDPSESQERKVEASNRVVVTREKEKKEDE